MSEKLTHSQVAAKLVVDGALANIAGNVDGKMPMSGRPVTPLQRSDLGLADGGGTLFYQVGGSGVFLDMNGAVASIFFADADYDDALPTIETALKRAYPKAKQIKDGLHPRKEKFKYRAYEVDTGNGKLALVEFDIPTSSAQQKRFEARVVAQARKN
ncbi:MAG: hypothetical protein QM759_12775 [Terricaulis sp.]